MTPKPSFLLEANSLVCIHIFFFLCFLLFLCMQLVYCPSWQTKGSCVCLLSAHGDRGVWWRKSADELQPRCCVYVAVAGSACGKNASANGEWLTGRGTVTDILFVNYVLLLLICRPLSWSVVNPWRMKRVTVFTSGNLPLRSVRAVAGYLNKWDVCLLEG